jgi:hypothetical protein
MMMKMTTTKKKKTRRKRRRRMKMMTTTTTNYRRYTELTVMFSWASRMSSLALERTTLEEKMNALSVAFSSAGSLKSIHTTD